jgi:hypothetical protein
MKKIYPFIGLLLIITIILEIINVHLANKLDSKSMYASQLQIEYSKLEQDNLILKSQVLKYTSFESIASRAAQLGFAEEKSFVSLYSPAEVALNK